MSTTLTPPSAPVVDTAAPPRPPEAAETMPRAPSGEAPPASPGAAPSARPRKAKHFLTRKRAIIGGIAILAAVGTARALRPTPIEVEAAPVAAGPMSVTVDADAVTRVRAHFAIAAPVSGLVERIALTQGDSVRTGEVVAVITAAPADVTARRIAEARLTAARGAEAQAEARVAQAAALLAQAERDAGRSRALAAAGALADRDAETAQLAVDTRRGDLQTARAQARIAAADRAQAAATLDAAAGAAGVRTGVRAPAAGRVLRVPERSARVVAAGTPLMELGDPTSLEVAADVLSSDATAIRPGQRVVLRGWGGEPLLGTVRRVEPAARTRVSALGVEEQRLTVLIDVANPPPTLGDGFRLETSTTVWSAAKVLSVPASALLRDGEQWRVFTVDDGRARRREVRIGHVGGGTAEVLSGLRAGEEVMVFPSDAVRDGVRVRARTP